VGGGRRLAVRGGWADGGAVCLQLRPAEAGAQAVRQGAAGRSETLQVVERTAGVVETTARC
jgi:hypothetical protein